MASNLPTPENNGDSVHKEQSNDAEQINIESPSDLSTQDLAVVQVDLKSANTLAKISAVAGPVSLIIGGIALSTLALIFSIISFMKTRRALNKVGEGTQLYLGARVVRQSAIISGVISLVALIINIVGVAILFPTLVDAFNSGDFSAVLGDGSGSVVNPSSSGGAWG